MSARSKARKRAVDLMYEADLRGDDPVSTLAERIALADPPISDYTIELVEGVTLRRVQIDQLLSDYSEGWTLDRMPGVDRAILRVGLYELLWSDGIPDAVAIDEAVELAKMLSTDDSPKFVNGILGRVLRDQIPSKLRSSVEAVPDRARGQNTP
jgi:transcription antitermination protein NusB